MTEITLFDGLDKSARTTLDAKAEHIRELGRVSAASAVEIGKELIAARSILETHGSQEDRRFGAWIGREFNWGLRNAYRFISVAIQFGDCDRAKLANVSLSALYLLSAPSTPEEVRETALGRAESGQHVTHEEVHAALQLHEPEEEETAGPDPGDEDDNEEDDEEPLTEWQQDQLASMEQEEARDDDLRKGVASLVAGMRSLESSGLVRKPVLDVLANCLTKCRRVLAKRDTAGKPGFTRHKKQGRAG